MTSGASMRHYIQSLRSSNFSRRSSCRSGNESGHSVLFHRASPAWWIPKFDSDILEGQYWCSTFPQIRFRFQLALIYIFLVSLSWCVYFSAVVAHHWFAFSAFSVALVISSSAAFLVTTTTFYQRHYSIVSILVAVSLCLVTLPAFLNCRHGFVAGIQGEVSPAGLLVLAMEVILLVYTVIPLPLYLCLIISIVYSIIVEVLSIGVASCDVGFSSILVRTLLHLGVHIIGIHIFIMTQVRMRCTFLKVGQLLLVRRELELEKQLKEKMILSVMPPKVAFWLLHEGHNEEEVMVSSRATNDSELKSLFRPFNMHRMENVSILFADIVGFTRMSSNKTAEQLVGLLNDLFGRFDLLCGRHGCEKISTLGDCYYCVAGCPEPCADHAQRCVDMGLSMIEAIGHFDQERKENVTMRVGVHTGTVLCGIVGSKRFKFDVWSHDVTLANQMESTGKPGQVHVTEKTYELLDDSYVVEEGSPHHNLKTYFVLDHKERVEDFPYIMEENVGPASPATYRNFSSSSSSNKKANSLPNILDGVENSDDQSCLNEPAITQLRSTRSASQDRKRRLYHQQRSQQDDLAPLSYNPATELRSSHAIVCPSGQNGHTDELSLFPSVESFIKAQGASTTNTLQRRSAESNAASDAERSSVFTPVPTDDVEREAKPPMPIHASLSRFHQLRKQSDLQMIRCIQEDESHRVYFMRPPLNLLTLFFIDPAMEKEYRARAHQPDPPGTQVTLDSPTYNTYLDILVSALIFSIVSLGCFVHFDLSWMWGMAFASSGLILLAMTTLFLNSLCGQRTERWFGRLHAWCSRWYAWHACGAVLMSLPIVAVISNFACRVVDERQESSRVFWYLFCMGLVHFCNFTQLNCWMKNALAAVAAVILILTVSTPICPCVIYNTVNVTGFNPAEGIDYERTELALCYEIILHLLLLLLLVCFLNREFEISFRLSFHCKTVAGRGKAKVQSLKDQADWLLHNIIPRHVVEQMKTRSGYSENHRQAGIIFASLVNFSEMYDESYLGGREYLRVLNELISDFDELLLNPQFRNVEKIKTIGSTFMAASGLNPDMRLQSQHPHQHLFDLVEFACSMQRVLNNFNQDLLEFNLILRIGYNCGDVTAGVIGTTKLYYDIWGDAVNIASRMDSTGVNGRLQTTEACVALLEERYLFERRGTVYVKGKDDMNVYLLVGPKIAK